MSEKAKPSKYNRSYWSAISGASPIKKIWGRLIVALLFALPLVAYAATTMLSRAIQTIGMVKFEDAALASSLIHQLQSVGILFLGTIILLSMVGMYFVFFVAVRVYGPQVALVKFIKQIQAGNFEAFRELRKDDQLIETWQALQDLATSLREKSR